MAIDNGGNIEFLLRKVEFVFGKTVSTPSDFQNLSADINSRLNEWISISTLKRLWGYVEYTNNPRKDTLDVLSRYIGYKDFSAFCDEAGDITRTEPRTGEIIQKNYPQVIFEKITEKYREYTRRNNGPDHKISVKVLFQWVFVLTAGIVLFISLLPAGEEVEQQKTVPVKDISTVHFNCYMKIDSVLSPYENGEIFTSRDSIRLRKTLQWLIDREYTGYEESPSKRESEEWAWKRLAEIGAEQ